MRAFFVIIPHPQYFLCRMDGVGYNVTKNRAI